MQLHLSRVILFTANMDQMVAFYREIALHSGGRKPGPRSPKIQFDVKDVAATREALIARGAKMGKVSSTDGLDLCGGKDPDGNPFSLSNRGQ